MAVPFEIPQQFARVPVFTHPQVILYILGWFYTSSATFGIASFVIVAILVGFEMVFHCAFKLHFSEMLSIFMCLVPVSPCIFFYKLST